MPPVAPGFAFRGPALDRDELLRERPDELDARWPAARVVVVDAEGHARFPEGEDAPALRGADLARERPAAASLLGVDGGTTWFALPHDTLAAPLPGRLDLRTAATAWPSFEATVLAQARALLHWQQRNRHCGDCGHGLALAKAGWVAR